PVDVGVGDGAPLQFQHQIGDAGVAGADRVGSVRGDRPWPAPVRQYIVENRQVMWCEVPQHVDVALHQTEIDAYRVDELDVAEYPAPTTATPIGSTARPPVSRRRRGGVPRRTSGEGW